MIGEMRLKYIEQNLSHDAEKDTYKWMMWL